MPPRTVQVLLALLVMVNGALAALIGRNVADGIRRQAVEEARAAWAPLDAPVYHDYDFEYEPVERRREGPYLIEVYREVEVVRDEGGRPLARRPTGETEVLRYVVEPAGVELLIDD